MATAMAMAALAMVSAPAPPLLPTSSSPSLPPAHLRFSSAPPPLSIISSPHDPSLPFANLLWFKGPYNAQIFVADNEPADSVVKRFRRAVSQVGVIAECRRRRFFETPQDILKRKRRANSQRRARRFVPRVLTDLKKKPEKPPAADDANDNWEYDGIADGF